MKICRGKIGKCYAIGEERFGYKEAVGGGGQITQEELKAKNLNLCFVGNNKVLIPLQFVQILRNTLESCCLERNGTKSRLFLLLLYFNIRVSIISKAEQAMKIVSFKFSTNFTTRWMQFMNLFKKEISSQSNNVACFTLELKSQKKKENIVCLVLYALSSSLLCRSRRLNR